MFGFGWPRVRTSHPKINPTRFPQIHSILFVGFNVSLDNLLTFLNIRGREPGLVGLPVVVDVAGELSPGPAMQKVQNLE